MASPLQFRLSRSLLRAGAILALVGCGAQAEARPAHLKALAEYYDRFLPSRLATCGSCHQVKPGVARPQSLEEAPHNAFGRALVESAQRLRGDGKRADLPSRLREIAGGDADGDGVANELELLAGTLPGERASTPPAALRPRLQKTRAELVAFLAAYRWRPFEQVQRPKPPVPKDPLWRSNPIDAIVASRREGAGLKARPEAPKQVLVRRLYLDLVGLSPEPGEVQAFLADTRPDAYRRLVDRLLEDPRYGERWGRHWMDVWRYSDWAGWGAQVRDSQPHIWRWRDWIVDSLNADKGYDRMVQEMLAGDELAPEDPSALAATGYLVRNYKLLSREKWMQDTVDHTGQAFLGLTVGCARCHDHMYDPITQKEYYQLRAVFEPHQVRTDWVPGEVDTRKAGLPRAFDANPDVPTYLFTRGDERTPQKDVVLPPAVPEALGGRMEVRKVELPRLARVPERQPHVIDALRADVARRLKAAEQEASGAGSADGIPALRLEAVRAEQQALEAVLKVEAVDESEGKSGSGWTEAARAAVAAQRVAALASARLEVALQESALASGRAPAEKKKTGEALAAARTVLVKAEGDSRRPLDNNFKPRIQSNYPAQSTGRRLAFAQWLTSRQNPLAARVAVNQIWMRHFGQSLVPTVADFGHAGLPPTHPELLDWLAAEFMESGWKMKSLHRIILNSRAYRMASTPDPEALKHDPDNKWYWRMNSRRMDAEIVRDNVLHVCGRLDLTRGGPDIDQNLGLEVRRRTLYFRHAAEKEMVFTNLFDGPSVAECYARKPTVAPQQALALANSRLALEQARVLGRELHSKVGTGSKPFIDAAFQRILCRPPTAAERTECELFLKQQAERLVRPGRESEQTATDLAVVDRPSADPNLRARENLVLVLLNHNDFVTIR